MPTSRRRKRQRSQRQARPSPYESLIRGVQSDETLQAWYERALWSFHRGPFPSQPGEELQSSAMARAFEWFLFDLRLPGSGLTPVEMWIDTQTTQHAWNAAVQERYRRFTRCQYGLFEVSSAPHPVLYLEELGTGREVHAVNSEGWLIPERGDVVAARLFPENAARLSRGPEIFELSPGSDIVFEDDRRVLEHYAGADALEVERLFGASADWIANGIGDNTLTKLADHFFKLMSGGAVRAETILRELRASEDPGRLIADILDEVLPLTKEEPPLFGMLVGALWLGLRQAPGASARKLSKLSGEWKEKLSSAFPERKGSPAPAPLEPIDDETFRLSEHEAARLRAIPQAADVEWVGCRQQLRSAICEPGKLPYYPDGVFWFERPSGLLVTAMVVPPHEPASILLTTLVEAISRPLAAGSPRRPARVSIGSRALAGRLAPALSPLGISVGLRYVEPGLAHALGEIEGRAASGTPGVDDDGLVALGSGGYLNLPGSTPERLERFFGAAAKFYRAAPWRVLADDRWIEIEVPGFASLGERTGRRSALRATAVIMGNGRETFGLALYFDPSDLDALMLDPDPAAALEVESLVVTFDDERETEPDIVAEAKEHRWPLAGRRAYPSGLRTMPDAPPRLIAGEELDLASAALDAVREFVTRHDKALRNPGARCTDRIKVEHVGTLTLILEPEALAEAE